MHPLVVIHGRQCCSLEKVQGKKTYNTTLKSCKLVNLFLVIFYLHLVCQTSTAPPLTCRISYVRFGVMQGRGRPTGNCDNYVQQ